MSDRKRPRPYQWVLDHPRIVAALTPIFEQLAADLAYLRLPPSPRRLARRAHKRKLRR